MKKKILLLFLILILLSGCGNRKEEVIEYNKEVHDWLVVKEFNYSGHTYIMFKDMDSYYSCASGVIHSPDCNCYGKNNKEEK